MKERQQKLKNKHVFPHNCGEIFRSIDIFGHPISLTFKGKHSYKTTFGAIVTAIVGLGIVAYALSRLQHMISRQDPVLSKKNFIRDLSGAPPFTPNEYGFDFAFGLGAPLDPSIGIYSANQVQQTISTDATGKVTRPASNSDL